jgi:molybdenum cofactor biosynthesis protein MoaC
METTSLSQQWGDKSSYRMIDVGDKVSTRRRAVAQGSIYLSKEAFVSLRDGKNPKGNVLSLAEAAGIMSAKRTSELIPLCHPLPLHYVHLSFELKEADFEVVVYCEAATVAPTGVEMEALAGVNGALLTIYDLSKAVNPVLTLSNIRLNLKEGGKSGKWTHPDYQPSHSQETEKKLLGVRVGILTVSDRVSQGKAQDSSGPLLAEFIKNAAGEMVKHQTVADDMELIRNAVLTLVRKEKADLIFTTGGTGLSSRDVTPEALEGIARRIIPGFGEYLRHDGAHFIATSWLSRSMACLVDQALVIALPGSKNAVMQGMNALADIVPHALHILRGGNHDRVS